MTWVVKNNQAYHIFKAGAKSIAVNVRYSYEVSEGVYQYVYVTFTWTPSPLNFTPNGTIETLLRLINIGMKERCCSRFWLFRYPC